MQADTVVLEVLPVLDGSAISVQVDHLACLALDDLLDHERGGCLVLTVILPDFLAAVRAVLVLAVILLDFPAAALADTAAQAP